MKTYLIIGNYLEKNKTAYVPGWDNLFSTKEGMSTIFQVEDYLCSILKDRTYDKAMVKTGKQLARKLGVRVRDASALIINESQKNHIEKHFNKEINKTIWITEAADN